MRFTLGHHELHGAYFYPDLMPPMNESRHNPPGREEEQKQCVEQYEAMLRDARKPYFDVDQYALIIGHYLDKNDYRRAKDTVDLALGQHPGDFDLRFWEAHVLMDSGRLTKALEALDALEKIDPRNADIQLHKGGIYSQQRNPKRAIQHFEAALKLTPDDHDNILLDIAFEQENMGDFERAIHSLQRAAGINPENESVLYELAHAFDQSDAHEECVRYFKEFTDAHPYSYVGWYNLGNALSALERLEESNSALDFCIAIEERFSSAYFTKARNMLVQGNYEEAVELYRETLAIEGPQAITFSYIGECFEKMERLNESLIHYDQAVALDPTWVDAWIGRGVVKDMQGRIPEALKDLEQAVHLRPDHSDANYYYGNALGRAGRYEEALLVYSRLNTIDPGGLDGWLDHADLLLQVKGAEASVKKMRECEMVHKLNPRYRYRLASYLLRCGREQDALLELEVALEEDHAGHTELIEHHPEVKQMPQVMHLIELYRK